MDLMVTDSRLPGRNPRNRKPFHPDETAGLTSPTPDCRSELVVAQYLWTMM